MKSTLKPQEFEIADNSRLKGKSKRNGFEFEKTEIQSNCLKKWDLTVFLSKDDPGHEINV